jgi:hypothetical protein
MFRNIGTANVLLSTCSASVDLANSVALSLASRLAIRRRFW